MKESPSMNAVDFLKRVSIFAHMSQNDLERLARRSRYQRFQPGEAIITEGDHDATLFVVIKGEVEVVKHMGETNQRSLHIFGPRSYFGEMALLDGLPRSASVMARSKVQVLSLAHWNFRQAIENYPAIGMELLQMLTRRIRALEKTFVHTLGTMLPICSACKRIRDDGDQWVPIEDYLLDHLETEFTHSICPQCACELYPEICIDGSDTNPSDPADKKK